MTSEEPEAQPFLAVRHGEAAYVTDLGTGPTVLAGAGSEAIVQLADGARPQGLLRWDGERATLERTTRSPAIVVNGKRLQNSTELKPGDELSVEDARLVFGLASPRSTGGRRALTHHEFRERLLEELARAGRRARPTCLVMLRARGGEGQRVLAAALTHFRAGDVVATYAPDEVELLLPDTSGGQARAVVARVLAAEGIEGYRAGVAVAPRDADTRERLLYAARRAVDSAGPDGFAEPPRGAGDAPAALIAEDPASRAVAERLEALAADGAPVLLTGEPSNGKAAFARLLHARSGRAAGPFVVLPCASLVDDDRIRSALGPAGDPSASAAWGARTGTLVLDEVCELPPPAQERLDEVLAALGAEARLVASTHLDLASLAARGAFAERLVGRLEGPEVEVPPLRQRPEDILPLALAFAREAGAADPVQLSPGALARLRSHPWPGNVLELRNALERAVRLAHGTEIMAEHLPSDSLPVQSGEGRLREHVDSIERDAIIKALAEHNHNQTHAARRLGISRRALIYKMEKYGLKPPPSSSRR